MSNNNSTIDRSDNLAAALAAEAERETRSASVREALTEATQEKQSAANALAAAEVRVQSIRDRLFAGDGSATADLQAAKVEVEAAETLSAGADARLRSAEIAASSMNTDTTLAVVVALVIDEALPGVEVIPVSAVPTSTPPSLPVAYVVQSKATTLNTIEGSISGGVQVKYVRQPIHRELDTRTIESTARAHKVRGKVGSAVSSGGQVVTDTVQMTVSSAWAPIPTIRGGAIKPFRLSTFAHGLEADVREAFASSADPRRGVTFGSGNANARIAQVDVNAGRATLQELGTDNGVRRIAVTVGVQVEGRKSCTYSGADMQHRMAQSLSTRQGEVAAGIGRIEAVEVTHQSRTETGGRLAYGRFVFVSQVAPA